MRICYLLNITFPAGCYNFSHYWWKPEKHGVMGTEWNPSEERSRLQHGATALSIQSKGITECLLKDLCDRETLFMLWMSIKIIKEALESPQALRSAA